MAGKAPLSFLLVSQAAHCSGELVDYRQILDEVEAGRLVFEPGLHHAGAWLLDHAIACRVKSEAGQRAFRKNRGADPAMDTLWASWFAAVDDSALGSQQDQCRRAARLAQLGSKLCLGLALSKGLPPELVQSEWDAMFVSPLRTNLFVRAVKEDLRGTVEEMIKHGFHRLDFKSGHHPLLSARSSAVMKMLLEAGMSPTFPALGEGSLIDATSRRNIGAEQKISIIQAVRESGVVQDPIEDRMDRLASALEKKTVEQLRAEMRAAQWSPGNRSSRRSPVVEWARRWIENPSNPSHSTSAALPWLARQPGIGIASTGQAWSDATWMWVASMEFDPAQSEIFFKASLDLPDVASKNRFAFLQSFIEKEALAGSFLERAINCALREVCFGLDRNPSKLEVFDCLFEECDGSHWVLHSYSNKVSRPADFDSVFRALSSLPDQQENLSRCMSLSLVVASLQEDERLAKSIHEAWESGVRPLSDTTSRGLVLSRSLTFAPHLAALVQSWAMEQQSPLPLNQSRSPRL